MIASSSTLRPSAQQQSQCSTRISAGADVGRASLK